MEMISGFLLWIADVSGIKWIRDEKNHIRKAVKALTFFVVGIMVVVIFFLLGYA